LAAIPGGRATDSWPSSKNSAATGDKDGAKKRWHYKPNHRLCERHVKRDRKPEEYRDIDCDIHQDHADCIPERDTDCTNRRCSQSKQ
jgi:hypothetical protein